MSKWVCEYCHDEAEGDIPFGWDLFWQCAVCGPCQEQAQDTYGLFWLALTHGGEFANGKPDPREGNRAGTIATIARTA